MVYTQKKILLFFLQRKLFLIVRSVLIQVFLHFSIVSLWTQDKSFLVQEGPALQSQTQHCISATGKWQEMCCGSFAELVKKNSLIYATLSGSKLQSMISGKHEVTVPLGTCCLKGCQGKVTQETPWEGSRHADMQACQLCPVVSPWLLGWGSI